MLIDSGIIFLDYFTLIISYSRSQAGAFNFTFCHFFFHIIALPIGESLDIFGNSAKISASVVPTIL